MKQFTSSWKASNKPNKQRLYVYSAPLHVKSAMLAAHLSKELREKLKKRSMRVRVGDKVVVMNGEHHKKNGKIESVDLQAQRVYIAGIEQVRKDGGKSLIPFHPSNLVITEMVSDKMRTKSRSQKAPAAKETKAPKAKPALKETKKGKESQ
ncbi:MAG: 50S ribosomal protein L24 [Nanoarchaeota archaeon]